jgi:GH3 auxin-responsive promoter
MPQRVPASNTSPYAVSFISSYPLCYLMHGLFAIADPTLAFINVTFSPLLYDFIKLLEEHWDTLVQAIEDGQLPNAALTRLGDLGELRPHLQVHLLVH